MTSPSGLPPRTCLRHETSVWALLGCCGVQEQATDVLAYLNSGAHHSGLHTLDAWRVGGLDTVVDGSAAALLREVSLLGCGSGLEGASACEGAGASAGAARLSEDWYKNMYAAAIARLGQHWTAVAVCNVGTTHPHPAPSELLVHPMIRLPVPQVW